MTQSLTISGATHSQASAASGRSPIKGAGSAACATAWSALGMVVDQLGHVIERIDDADYTRSPVSHFSGAIGGHVRHCLDHVRALVNAVGDEEAKLDYDARDRGTAIESDRAAALEATRRLGGEIAVIAAAGSSLERSLHITTVLTGDGQSLQADTTVAREIAFVLSHTVHHNAMIAAMVRGCDCQDASVLPDRFGYAPSTIVHLKRADGS